MIRFEKHSLACMKRVGGCSVLFRYNVECVLEAGFPIIPVVSQTGK